MNALGHGHVNTIIAKGTRKYTNLLIFLNLVQLLLKFQFTIFILVKFLREHSSPYVHSR